ncbi:MAG TPA: phosphatidate cytidylyltransferase [Methylomirabilota bacterium]|jgi:phosphatidate cytidylyltransferase|nr:phosphatidate cytidylyltransferase [Methylomirabilota bacterium]
MPGAHGMPLPTPLERSTTSRWSELAKRALSTVVLLPLFIWIVLGGAPLAFDLMIVAVGILASWEFSRMFQRAGVPVFRDAGVVLGALLTASFLAPERIALVATASVMAVLALSLARPEPGPARWQAVAVTLLGLAWINALLGHTILLRALPEGLHWVLLLVWVTWIGETAAYTVGSLVGRHKLAPGISPGKTVEGALAQLVGSPLAALAAQGWLFPGLSTRDALLVGLLLGVVGQLGDLAESALKRSVGTKDAGQLIPGHGGMLDRVDGLLFNAPALFYYVTHGRMWSA